jgi:MYXO-CTERM domain-containing protein
MATAVFATALLAHPLAHAHIDMTGALKSRGGDQKNFPCDGKRGDGPVYTFEPGTTITLNLQESIPHPSYFRIAFDNDGDDAFVEPKSIKPIDPSRGCPSGPKDQCGESDFCNVKSSDGGATVLWDNLDPHMAGSAKAYSWTIKLPNVECENCTIQVLQIMEDDAFHGPYCPTGSCMDNGVEDIYHRCIDITLKKGAMNSPGVATTEVKNTGMECVQFGATTPTAGTGASGAGGAAGGVATAGAAATAGTTASAAGTGSAGMTAANTGTGGSTSTVPPTMQTAGTGASTAGTSRPAAAGSTSSTPTTVGSMQNASSMTAGTGAPVATGTGAPVATAPAESSGCSVQNTGTDASRAGWLALIGALAVFRRRRWLQSARRR